MAKDPFEQFAVPTEMRAFVEQSVTQARQAFDGFIEAANKAMGQLQGHAQAAHSGATEIAHKSMIRAKAYAGQGRGGTHAAAIRIFKPPDAGAVVPGPGSWTKCRQDRGG